MPIVNYDVEVIIQEQNPICWVASCAMVKGWGTQSSVGVGEFTGGFDPSNSCIENLAANWTECTDLMNTWGFSMKTVADLTSGEMTGDDLAAALLEKGPAVLLHVCKDFPYGVQWGDTSTMDGAHAVVLTGVDTESERAFFNNPWGDKDQSAGLEQVIQHINQDAQLGRTIGFYSA
jgi:Papain-like cysteine protease AvrRpt2